MSQDESLKQTHDKMRAALDRQLLQVLEQDELASAAILTAAIKRVEQLGKEMATDPSDDMADMIQRLKQEDAIVPDIDMEADDPATDDRY